MKIDEMIRRPAFWFASGFGAGLSPIAPGTVGAAVALLPWALLSTLPWHEYLAITAAVFALGVWAAQDVIAELKIEDPGVVVMDEWIGVWITLFLAPPGWIWVLAGFALFRLFDILKPWPVNWVDDHVKGGFGAMFDDALAGLYAFALLQLAAWQAPNLLAWWQQLGG